MQSMPVQRSIIKTSAPVRIVIKDDLLKPLTNLQRADYNSFQNACMQLAASDAPEVAVDLSHCTYLSSLFIGVLVDTITQMKEDGKTVRVQVSPNVGRLLHMAHLYHLFAFDICEPTA